MLKIMCCTIVDTKRQEDTFVLQFCAWFKHRPVHKRNDSCLGDDFSHPTTIFIPCNYLVHGIPKEKFESRRR